MKLTTKRLKQLIREEIQKIQEFTNNRSLEQMDGKTFIDKLSASAEKLKNDKYVQGDNLKAQAAVAEALLSIAKMQGFKNGKEGARWMHDNAAQMVKKRLPREVLEYANIGAILTDFLAI